MARIIPLKREGAPSATAAAGLAACAGKVGEVILFPGVRYERWEEPQPGQPGRRLETAATARVGRDWLEI